MAPLRLPFCYAQLFCDAAVVAQPGYLALPTELAVAVCFEPAVESAGGNCHHLRRREKDVVAALSLVVGIDLLQFRLPG